MDIRTLSLFILAIGVILIAIGGNNWITVENNAKRLDDYIEARRAAEIDRINNLTGVEQMRARARITKEITSDIQMLLRGYQKRAKRDHTVSYLLIVSGILVIILGIGMRVSSSKKPNGGEVPR